MKHGKPLGWATEGDGREDVEIKDVYVCRTSCLLTQFIPGLIEDNPIMYVDPHITHAQRKIKQKIVWNRLKKMLSPWFMIYICTHHINEQLQESY